MKKTLAILLALILALVNVSLALAGSEGVEEEEPAAAADPYNGKLDAVLKLPKSFTAEHGVSPAETFTFKFEGVSYTSPADLAAKKDSTSTDAEDIPAVGNVSVSFAKDDNEDKEVAITLPDYEYGRYIYKVTEVVPDTKTAGIAYAEDKVMYMVVTVFSDSDNQPDDAPGAKHFVAVLHEDSVTGDKTDRIFENTYDAGSLTVSKELKGNMADLTDTFDFTISFTAETGAAISDAQKAAIEITGVTGAWDGLDYKVTLGHKESITFANIPAGTTYSVAETEKDGYEMKDVPGDGKIEGGDEDTWAVTNTREVPVDTGITLETVPYIMILAVTMIGAALLVLRKREEY